MSDLILEVAGEKKTFAPGITPGKVFAENGKLGRNAIAARLDDRLLDLDRPITSSGALSPVNPDDPEALDILRHSTSHIMAEAVRSLFPGVKVTIGPSIEPGFTTISTTKNRSRPRICRALKSVCPRSSSRICPLPGGR